MSEQAQGRFWSGIDIPKTVAGTLAAVSAAVVGSFLGVAGTLIGAAVAAVISSIGTEVYHRSIDRGAKRLQSAFTVAPAAVGTPDVPAADDESPSGEPVRRIHWKRVALAAGAFFALGMGTLTTAEMFAGRSAADVTSGRDNGSPTILFQSVGEDSGDEPEMVTPSTAPSSSPSSSSRATTAEEPPAPEGTTAPTTPAETESPATPEPTQDDPKLSETVSEGQPETSVE